MGTMSGRSGKKIESCILYCSYHRCIVSFFILNPFMTYLNGPVNVVFAVFPLRDGFVFPQFYGDYSCQCCLCCVSFKSGLQSFTNFI